MAKFTAGNAVEGLEYDFTEYVPGCQGRIAEPTAGQVEAYEEALRRIRGGPPSAESDVTEEAEVDGRPAGQRTAEAISAVCSGAPSTSDLLALPWRVRLAFSGWLWRELLNPTRSTAGTKPSLAVVRDDGSSA